MKQGKIIEFRASSTEKIDRLTWISGILDITDFLVSDLQVLMSQENRNFGIVKSYFHTLSDSYSKIREGQTEQEILSYSRLLYLLQPLIISQYRWLGKKLSPADADIVLVHKFLTDLLGGDLSGYNHTKELETIKKVITNMFNYIRNPFKNNEMTPFVSLIKEIQEQGITGKYFLDEIDLVNPDENKKKEILKNPGERVDSGTIVNEINL